MHVKIQIKNNNNLNCFINTVNPLLIKYKNKNLKAVIKKTKINFLQKLHLKTKLI